MIERELAWLQAHPAAGAVFCSDVFIDADGREFGRRPPARDRRLEVFELRDDLERSPRAQQQLPALPDGDRTGERLSSRWRLPRQGVQEHLRSRDVASDCARYEIGVLEDHLLRYRRGHGSSSEHHRVRTEPFRLYRILDAELEAGGRAIAKPDALRAYEAHRNVDVVLRAVNHYILGEKASSLRTLKEARIRSLARSGAIQRGRMVALALGLHLLLRLPRIPAVARLFDRRWHGARRPAGG